MKPLHGICLVMDYTAGSRRNLANWEGLEFMEPLCGLLINNM